MHEPLTHENEDEAERLRLQQLRQAFGATLQRNIDRAIAAKSSIESRWLEDIRQYNGQYDADTKAVLDAAKRSTAFVNITRAKCNAAESRLAEMLLPTDDRNWAIQPTPIPKLPNGADDQVREFAREAASKMQREMDDALAESDFNAVLRDVIHDAAVLGTGILKGPVIRNRIRRSWRKQQLPDGTSVHRVDVSEDLRPAAECVSPWDLFIDPDARTLQEAEFIIQRHRMTRQQLRELGKTGFDTQAITELLQSDGRQRAMQGQVDQSRSDTSGYGDGRFELWEYHGEFARDDLLAAGLPDSEALPDAISGTAWICGQVVLRVAMNVLDSGEQPYCLFTWERDDTNPFGMGVPAMCRDSQRVANASWRMLLDNAAMSVMPQVVINGKAVRPVDGSWVLRPGKLWEITQDGMPVSNVFGAFPVTANLGELASLFQQARALVDDETGLPMIAQGQQEPAVTKTAQGMAMLMSSASTVLRRLVRHFDDDVTRPFLRRLYDWFMQYGDNEAAKGDYDIIPLGSSSLMVKEQTQQGLLNLLQLAQGSPALAPITDIPALYRKLVQAMSINADGLIKSDEEIRTLQQQTSQPRQEQNDPAQLRAQVEQGKLQLESQKLQQQAAMQQQQAQLDVARLQLEKAGQEQDAQMRLLQIQNEAETTGAEIAAAREQTRMSIDSKHQLFNAEAMLRQQTGAGI